jgi:hypothetical protein
MPQELTKQQASRLTSEEYMQVTADGWKVIVGGKPSERERTWEMVEDVLRSVSPLFAQGWNSQLLQKLQALADAGPTMKSAHLRPSRNDSHQQ